MKPDGAEYTGEGRQKSVAEHLAEMTGRPVEEFLVPDNIEYPDLDELESVPEEDWPDE